MLFKSCRFLTVAMLTVFLCLFVGSSWAAESLVARVGSVPVTSFELNRELQLKVPLASSFHAGISQEKIEVLKKEALADLVERAYMVHYALDNGIAVPKAEVDAVYDPVEKRYGSKRKLAKALGNESISDLRSSIFRKLLADKALEVAVKEKVSVSEEQLKTFFEANKERYKRPQQFKASHILLEVDPAASKEQRQERLEFAQGLVKRARAGEDFYNLAYKNSDDPTKYVGGDMGYFHKGQVLKELEDVIVTMKVGEISDPIKTLYGYSVIKLVENNPPTQLTFDDVKVKLTAKEREKQFEAKKAAWMESLKNSYSVEYLSK